ATVTFSPPDVSKVLTGTSDAGNGQFDAVIGERANYTLTLTIPEGRILSSAINDLLPPGLGGSVIITGVTYSSGVSSTNTPSTGTVPSSGNFSFDTASGALSLNFGTITNTNTNNAVDETITITFSAVVTDVMSNQGLNSPGAATTLTNTATFNYVTNVDGVATPQSDTSTSGAVTVVEPTLTISKSVDQPTTDAGNTLTYTINIGNTSGYTAYDATFRDPISALLTGAAIGTVTTSGFGAFTPPTASDFEIVNLSGVNTLRLKPSFDLDIPTGATIQITFTATVVSTIEAGQQINNTAVIDWTSLNGVVAGERTGAGDQTTPGAPGNPSTTDPAVLDNYVIASSVITTAVPLVASKVLVTGVRTETTDPFVTIGEIVTYRITIVLPEGVTNGLSVRDNLPAGMAYVAGSAVADFTGFAGYTGTVGTPPTMTTQPQTGTTYLDGTDILFNFSDITVPSTLGTADNTFTITFQAVVLDVAGNDGVLPGQSTLTNTASLTTSVITTAQTIPGAPVVTMQEPNLQIVPSVVVNGAGTVGDAGDPIVYTSTISHTANSTLGAYDVTYNDVLPSQVNATSFTAFIGATDVSSHFELVLVGSNYVMRTKAGDSVDLPLGQQLVVRVTGTLNDTVTPNSTITNDNIAITYTNLDGDVSVTGGYNPATDVTTDHERVYNTAGTISTTVPTITAVKALQATSRTETTGNFVTPGEIVTYRISVTLPEGTINGLTITDALPVGMAYVPGTVSIVSGFNGTVAINTASAVGGGTFQSGTDVLFTFSNGVVTGDNVTGNNVLVLEFQTVVLDVASNSGYATQTVLPNTGSFSTATVPSTNLNTVNVTVQEPNLAASQTVTVNGVANGVGDAGDPVVYTTTIRHNNAGITGPDSTLAAYDVTYLDALPPQFLPNSGTSFTVTHSTLGNISSLFELVELTPGNWTLRTIAGQSFDLALLENVTVAVSGTLTQAVTPNQSITNTANISYSNLNGDVTNSSGSIVTGTADGSYNPTLDVTTDRERLYNTTAPVTITTAQGNFGKTLVDTSFAWTTGANVAPGELVTYALRVTLPEGTIPGLTVVDILPPGLQYLSSSVVTTAAGSFGVLGSNFNGSFGAPVVTGGVSAGDDVTFTFTTISVAGDNVTGNNSFVILITARVLDVPANEGILPGQTALPNSASFDVPGDGVPPVTTPPVDVTVVEPQLQVVKDVLNADTTVDA
ncbi:MAG TPA: isopeptide-forming domain-containing fimbrial protein, partial [Myxococcota bacterium]